MIQVTPHKVGFRSTLRVVNSIVVAVPLCSIADLYANYLWRSTLRKRVLERLSLHSPSVAADRRQLETIQLQQNREQKKVKVAHLKLNPKTAINGFPCSGTSLACISIYRLSLNYCETLENHSITTNWRKNSMIGAFADTSRRAWA